MAASTDFGDYSLEQRIGIGGMAEVFLAYRKRGGPEPVCVKRVLPGFLEDEPFATMFFDEARLAQRLMHPNVVHVFDAGEVGGRPYLAMEYVEGPSLERLQALVLERQELLPVEVCVDIGVQLCRALHYVHGIEIDGAPQQVVHRDVSPANVLLKRDGTVKLTDFGVARAADRLTRTQPGLTKGKAPYMSPEQARAEDIDHRSDQFAAGILLWELLTGKKLFDAKSAVASLEKVVGARVAAPSSLRKSVPKAIDVVILRALERDRDKRYPDMAAFEHALEQTVLPLGVDDRESRVGSELERLRPPPAARADEPRLESRGVQELVVESSLTDTSLDGADRFSPTNSARALPLFGPERTTRVHEEALAPRARRPSWAALVVVLMALIAGSVAGAVWLFPEQMRALPLLGALLDEAAARVRELTPIEPERVLPPVARKKPSPAAEANADVLEGKAAEALLAGEHRRALKLLREAADLTPERASLHRKLAMAYRALDEDELAKRHLERYLELSPAATDRGAVRRLLEEISGRH